MKIVIVNFSGREVGNCQAISQVVGDVHLSDKVYIYHFSSLTVHPCGKCNYECFGREESCPYQDDAVYEIYKKVTVCDLAYFILPNYCDYPNANYFLFNERSQCFFQHRPELLERYLAVSKKFIVVSNTETDHFIQAFRYQISENEQPNVLFLAAKKYQKKSIVGDIMDSEKAKKDVKEFCRNDVKESV